jgi:nucleoside 2-deoxyribosyltransferase
MVNRITKSGRTLAHECLVTTPMGSKPYECVAGSMDFDRIYSAAIRPAIEAVGLKPRRLDELDYGASIQRSVLRALAESHCVIADITTRNANVMYEIGVRHALRKSTTILLKESREVTPFDLHGVPTLIYKCETGAMSDSEAEELRSMLSERLATRLRSDSVDSPLHEMQLLDFSSVFNQFKILPPQHERHRKKLEEFQRSTDSERSVFVMTKYPEPGSHPRDGELQRVIDVVATAVRARGFRPRLASEKEYYDNLWDNVELYLLGCGRGIAIVEDKYTPEMNPNVAMEWGWMRGAGKRVLFLVEENFQSLRADWHGLLRKTFNWSNPETTIPKHVKSWLQASN